jgi:hypothetical protein
MQAQAPPEFLRAVVDGAFESALVVLSNGTIWHMNEPSHRMFPFLNEAGSRSVIPAHVSDYFSFSTSNAASMSWEDFIAGEPFLNNICNAADARAPGSGENFPLKINVVRIKCPELNLAGSYESVQDDFYYILYMQEAENELVAELQNQTNINDGILDACKKVNIFPCAFGFIIWLVYLSSSPQSIFSIQLLTRCLS